MTTYVRCTSCGQPWYGNPSQVCNQCKIIQQQKAHLDLIRQQSYRQSGEIGYNGPPPTTHITTVWEEVCIYLPPMIYIAVVLWAVMHFMIGMI